jgi:hypothetical protein
LTSGIIITTHRHSDGNGDRGGDCSTDDERGDTGDLIGNEDPCRNGAHGYADGDDRYPLHRRLPPSTAVRLVTQVVAQLGR